MFDSDSVKVGILVLIGFISFLLAVAGGINMNTYLEKERSKDCIQAGMIWAEGSCVRDVDDLRDID